MLAFGSLVYVWPVGVAALHFDYLCNQGIRDPRQTLPPHNLTQFSLMVLACFVFSLILWELCLRDRVALRLPIFLLPIVALCWVALCVWPIGYILSAFFRVL